LALLFAELLLATGTGGRAQTLRTVLAFFLARRTTRRIGANQFLTAARATQNLTHHSPSAFVASHIMSTLGASRVGVTKDFQGGVGLALVTLKSLVVLALLEESADLLTKIWVGLREHFRTRFHGGKEFEI